MQKYTEKSEQMGRHAYLILAHSNFGQLKKLVGLLDDPRNDIFIHVDGKASFDRHCLDGICRNSRLVLTDRRYRVHWGGVSIMRAELLLLNTALKAGEYSYFHLLSGMDLPIKDQDAIHAFFDSHAGKEFIDLWDLTPDMKARMIYWTPFPEGERNFMLHAVNKTFRNIQKTTGHTINNGVDFRYGSQWFSITEACAKYITGNAAWLEKVFGHTIICDEFFLVTAVWNSPFREAIFNTSTSRTEFGNMRLIDWSRGESIRHPWTFRASDWDQLMASPCLWARKFDERKDSRIIDMICSRFRHTDSPQQNQN